MAVRTLVVKLLDQNGARLLDVDDDDDRSKFWADAKGPQVIQWKLHKDTPTRFKFTNIGLSAPGFAFFNNPVPGVFKGLELLKARRVVSIKNYHLDNSSDGTWYYALRVSDGTIEYSTTYDITTGGIVQATGTTHMTSFSYNNPNIINR
jgi:hypothetical protein